MVKKLHLGVESSGPPPSPLHTPSVPPPVQGHNTGPSFPEEAFGGNEVCPVPAFGYNGRRMLRALIEPLIARYKGALATGGLLAGRKGVTQ